MSKYQLSDIVLPIDMQQDFSTGYGYIVDESEQDWHVDCDGHAFYNGYVVKCGHCYTIWYTPTSYRKAQIDAG